MSKKISQREAIRLRRRVSELEDAEHSRLNRWAGQWPGSVHLGSVTRPADWLNGRIEAARMLGHAVVVSIENNRETINFYASKLSKP